MMLRLREALWLWLSAALLAVGGCGSGSDLAPVSGTVTYKGQPVAGATVVFMGDGNTRPATAITAADGSYSLMTLDSAGDVAGHLLRRRDQNGCSVGEGRAAEHGRGRQDCQSPAAAPQGTAAGQIWRRVQDAAHVRHQAGEQPVRPATHGLSVALSWCQGNGAAHPRPRGQLWMALNDAQDSTIRFARCALTRMRTIAPLVKGRKSLSVPSEKITPASGISDSTISSWPPSSHPVTRVACDRLLTKGSRTAQIRRRSSQRSWGGREASAPESGSRRRPC